MHCVNMENETITRFVLVQAWGRPPVAKMLQGGLWPDRRMPRRKVHVCVRAMCIYVCVRACMCALLSVCLWITCYCWAGVPASRAKASGQHAGKGAGKIVGQEGSAGAESVFAGTGSAPGRAVGGGRGQAGAGVSQGAGGKQGAARCEEIQEPALANARGGIRSTLGAGEIPMKCCKEQRLRVGVGKSRESADQSARVEQLVSRLGGDTLAFVKGKHALLLK